MWERDMPATLELPVTPRCLYRYRKLSDDRLDQELDAIKNKYLWCAKFTKMNDPMEGFFLRATESTEVSDDYGYREAAKQICSDMADKVGIASFCDTYENELMWAHYAENYTGMCIEYNTDALVAGLPEDVSLVRLDYDDLPPKILGKKDYEAIKAILSQKKGSWAYEREWRVIRPMPEKVEIKGSFVTHIYFGSRTKPEHKESLLKEFRNNGIAISDMKVNGYKHDWQLQSGS
jgi:hypothetical protein